MNRVKEVFDQLEGWKCKSQSCLGYRTYVLQNGRLLAFFLFSRPIGGTDRRSASGGFAIDKGIFGAAFDFAIDVR
nr:hypothetical protein [Pseudomonas sp. MF7453]